MAIAFINGNAARDAFFKEGDNTEFAALTVKETYKDRNGDEQVGGYHDIIAFGTDAKRLALVEEGDPISVKASIRYRPDKRFVSTQDEEKNPFMPQYLIMEFLESRQPAKSNNDDDPFGDV